MQTGAEGRRPRDRDRDTDKDTGKNRDRQTQSEKGRAWDTGKDTDKDRDRQTDTEREGESGGRTASQQLPGAASALAKRWGRIAAAAPGSAACQNPIIKDVVRWYETKPLTRAK